LRIDRQFPEVLAMGAPKRERVEAIRRSQAVAMINPPPVAAPSTTARVGTGKCSILAIPASIRRS
jgi:hypothetical protein